MKTILKWPAVAAALAAVVAVPAAGKGSDFEGEWERYVREFIERYQLDDAQKQRALAILKDCQEQARNYLARRQSTLDRLDEEAKKLAGEKDKIEELKKINEQRAKITETVTQIFEKRLKPRLERLPTTAQRQAAELRKNPASTTRTPTRQPVGPVKPVEPAEEPEPEPEPEPEEPPPDDDEG